MKKIVLIILGLVVAGGIVAVCFCAFTVSRSVTIDASLDIVAPQVSSLSNWKNWYGEGVGRITLVSGGPVSVIVRDTSGSLEGVAVTPSMDGRNTRVIWSRPMTIWGCVFGDARAEMVRALASLKHYIEDPRSYYGFDIHIRPVTDTLFATRDARVVEAAVEVKRVELLQALRGYLKDHPEMQVGDSVISGREAVEDGLVHLVVGVPVRHRGPASDSVRFLELPRGGRLLSGVCDEEHVAELRRAMDRYMADKRLQMVAIPFSERGLTGSGYALNYPIW